MCVPIMLVFLAGTSAGASVGGVSLDVYNSRSGQLYRHVSVPSRPSLGVSWVPGQLGASLPPSEAGAWIPPPSRINRPGRSPADIERLAAGADNITVVGTWRVLCLLVDFPDHPPQWHGGTAGATHYRDLLFSQGTHLTGSFYDYYREVSYGRFTVAGTVSGGTAGWYRAPSPYATYTNNASGLGPYPNNAQKLVEELVDLADPDVNYADYDNDRDGYVDALFVVHSGPASQTVAPAQKPHHLSNHKWEIADRRRDGRVISVYCMQAENARLGAFAHEFGHILGLPDLYDTDGSSNGIGSWSLMADGDHLGDPPESRPGHPDAWCKYRLGWLNPTVVQGRQTGVVIPPVETHAKAYALWKDGSPGREYFLIENRQRIGFDGRLPGIGLCIWHVDEAKFARQNTQEWWPGKPTGDGKHYLVALEQADGAWDLEHRTNEGDAGDPFPGLRNRRVFDATSTPDSLSYGGGQTGVRVWNMRESADRPEITANLQAGTPTVAAPAEVVITPQAPSPDEDLTATTTASVPDAVSEFTWWLSIDGGQTYTRKQGAETNQLSKTYTEPWQMWQARVRLKVGDSYSDWTSSWPVTILPGVDPAGNRVRRTWFAHQHTRPPGLTDAQWNEHYYNSDGRSWATAFHYLPNATGKVQSGDMILFGPGDHTNGTPDFTGVSLMSTAPRDPKVCEATITGPLKLGGTRCVAYGLTINLESSAPTTVEGCRGKVTWIPAVDGAMKVQEFTGELWATKTAGKRLQIDVRRSALTMMQIRPPFAGDAAETRITVTENTITGLAFIQGSADTGLTGDVRVTGNTVKRANLTVMTHRCSAVVADNTVERGQLFCTAQSARVLRNQVTGPAGGPYDAGLSCTAPTLRVSGNVVSGASGPGLVVAGGTESQPADVSDNTLSGNKGGGLLAIGGSLAFTYVNIHDNRITDNQSTSDESRGGGIYLKGQTYSTVANNLISGNSAVDGGGIYSAGVTAVVRNNRILSNTATERGGGVFCGPSTQRETFEENLIQGNKARNGGGVWYRRGEFWRNTVVENEARENGGGVFRALSAVSHGPLLTNNVIARNRAMNGGGVCLGDDASVPSYWVSGGALEGNTLVANRATHGGGVYAGTQRSPASPYPIVVKNCIITDSTRGGGIEQGPGVAVQPSYNNVFNNAGGNYIGLPNQKGVNGNLSVSPRYVDPTGDYHLQSQAGHWDATAKAWVKDEATSPCIDAGDPTSPYGEEAEPNGDRVNMGAYGNTREASKSFVSMMTDHSPDSGDTGVPLTAAIRIVFRWNLYQDTVGPRFSLTPAGGSKVAGTFQWPVAGQRMVFRPSAPLQPNTKYTVELAKGIKRVTGEVISWSESFSFTTGAASAGASMITACAANAVGGTGAITLGLSIPASVSVSILNLAGRTVATLPPRDLPSGLSTVLWDGRSLTGTPVPAGRYLVSVTARSPDRAESRALTVLSLAR